MSKISKIAVPGVAEPYDIEAYKALSIPFGQVDSTSTDTAYTAQIEGITSLYDGVCVYLKNGVITSNKNGFTLNVNGLGAKPVYGTLAAATKSGTVFNINYTMLFVYNSSRVSGGCWDIFYGYNSDTNTLAYNVRVGATPPTTSNKLVKYGIAFTKADGHLLSSNTTGTTVTSKALTAIEFDPFAPIYYYPTTAVAANGSPSATYLYQQYSTVDFRYAFNTGSTLVIGKPIYVRCVPQIDGTVKLDGNNCIVQELPTTDDNKVYIYLGYAYGTYQIFLDSNHPVYCYRNGRIQIWTGIQKVSDLINDTGYITSSDIPVTSVNGQTGAVTITVPSASSSTPADLGTAAIGSSNDYARADHVHKLPSASDIGAYVKPNSGIPASDLASGVIPEKLVVTYTTTNMVTATCDHTFAEIVTALQAKTPIEAYLSLGSNNIIAALTTINFSGSHVAMALTYIPQATNKLTVAILFHDSSEISIGSSVPVVPTDGYSSTPNMDGAGDAGSFDFGFSFGNHQHPTDTTRAPLASPSFTGIPTAPTPTADNDSTQIANTGWVRDRIDGLGTVFNLKGTKTDAVSLPTVNNTIGDVWYVTAESVGYIWLKDETNHERWEKFGEPIELPATYTPSAHMHSYTDISGLGSLATVNTVSWSSVTNTPATYTPSVHTHDYAASSHSHVWSAITNPPSSYTPSAHTHTWANISNPPSSYTPSAHSHAWSQITNTPTTYTPSAHTHADLAPINSPQFTGTPTAPSPNSDNNSIAIANTAWVNAAISSALEATDFITAEDLPATYTPSVHTHTWANISNPPASYTPSSHSHSWSEITNTPASYTPSTHTHSEYALINSPQFTGTPTAPDIDFEETPTYSQIATENWVNQKVITVITITAEEIDREIVYTYEPNLSLAELQELAQSNRLQLIYNNTIYPFARYYTWRPGMFGSLHHVFEFSRIQYADMNDIATAVGVQRINFEYDTTTSLFLEPDLTELGFLTTNWHDQYTVQDTTLIIGDVPVEENNVSPTPNPDGEK